MKDKENRQFHIRSRGLVAVLAAVLIGFGYVLYDLQIVHGAEYRERSQRKIAQTETVEAARGSLLDRYGRELVTNRTSYNVALETSRMGEDKNAVLLELTAKGSTKGGMVRCWSCWTSAGSKRWSGPIPCPSPPRPLMCLRWTPPPTWR